MNVTLLDIAHKTSLAKITVSQIMRGTGRVRPETRRRVLAAAKELGYHPNRAAQAMCKGCFDTVGLAFRSESYHVDLPPGIISKIAETLEINGLNLILIKAPDNLLLQNNSLKGISSKFMVDGLIVSCWGAISDELREIADKTVFPASWINTDSPHNSVRPDDKGAGRIATEHLLRLGHRKIAYVVACGAGPAEHFSSNERIAGYSEAMKAAGLPLWIFRRNVMHEKRFEEFSELFSSVEQATAFVADGSNVAQPLILRGTSLGFKIPEDFSVVCIGGNTHPLGISVTCLPYPEFEMGATSVKILLDRINNQNYPLPSSIIPFGEITGNTCAPPHPAQRTKNSPLKRRKYHVEK